MKSRTYDRAHKYLAGIIRFLFRVHVHGAENEPDESEGPYILVSNHISNPDPVLLCASTGKQQPMFMGKKELFKIPVLRSVIKAFGAFPVDRNGADAGVVRKTIKMLEDGMCIGMFPQGHRRKGIEPRQTEVKNGVAMIAVRTKATVLPCFIKTKKYRIVPFRRVDIFIGKPIKFEELEYDESAKGEYSRIAGMIFDRMCSLGESEVER